MASYSEVADRLGMEIKSLQDKMDKEPDRRLKASFQRRIEQIKNYLSEKLPIGQKKAADAELQNKVEKAETYDDFKDIDTEFNKEEGTAMGMKYGGEFGMGGKLPQHGLLGNINAGGIIGGALGTLAGPLGTVAGATIGNKIGSAIGGGNNSGSSIAPSPMQTVQNSIASNPFTNGSMNQPMMQQPMMGMQPPMPMGPPPGYKTVHDAFYAMGGKIKDKGTPQYGLGDWLQTGDWNGDGMTSPLSKALWKGADFLTESAGNLGRMYDPLNIGYGKALRRGAGNIIGDDRHQRGLDQATDFTSNLVGGAVKGAVNSIPYGGFATGLGNKIGGATNRFFGNTNPDYVGQNKWEGYGSGLGQIGGAVGAGILSGGALAPTAIGSGMTGAADIMNTAAQDKYGNITRPGWETAANITNFASIVPGMMGGDISSIGSMFKYGGKINQYATDGTIDWNTVEAGNTGTYVPEANTGGMSTVESDGTVTGNTDSDNWAALGQKALDMLPMFTRGVQTAGRTAGEMAPIMQNMMLLNQPSSYMWNPFYNANESYMYDILNQQEADLGMARKFMQTPEYFDPTGALMELESGYDRAKRGLDFYSDPAAGMQANMMMDANLIDKRMGTLADYYEKNRLASGPESMAVKYGKSAGLYDNIFSKLHQLGAERTQADLGAFDWNNRVDAARTGIGNATAQDISEYTQGARNNTMMGNALDTMGAFYGYDDLYGIRMNDQMT